MLTTPEMKQRLADEGAEPIASTPADFAAFVKSEIAAVERGRARGEDPAGGLGQIASSTAATALVVTVSSSLALIDNQLRAALLTARFVVAT